MSRGLLHHVLTHPIYAGRIRHKEQVFEGQHPAIIDPARWDALQENLSAGAAKARTWRISALQLEGAIASALQKRIMQLSEPCLIGMEACGSSHYWARELTKLGHDVRLTPANYVKPYVKRGKSDAVDAEAIFEAVTRPTMRFVAPKSEAQQAVLFLHRARDLIVRQASTTGNSGNGQQDGSDHLGGVDQKRILSAPHGLNEGEQNHQASKTLEMMKHSQPANQDTPSNVRDTLLSDKP